MQGWRENALVGMGVVTGLAGTGDSSNHRVTRQALSNAFQQFNLNIPVDQVASRNVAIVMVSARLPAFALDGDSIDVMVTSAGDARSLAGGNLMLTPLKAANGQVYALAQGPVSVGGYRHDANGNVAQKNHPTAGLVPGGAIVERTVRAETLQESARPSYVTFVLNQPDHTTSARVAQAINAAQAEGIASPRDAATVSIKVPDARQTSLVAYLSKIEEILVNPGSRARVIINERAGTVVSGGDVRISRVTVTHGDIRVQISTQNSASQPLVLGEASPGTRSLIVSNTRVDVEEPQAAGLVTADTTVEDLVRALIRMRASTRDIIAVLQAVKAAGALHAELIIQ